MWIMLSRNRPDLAQRVFSKVTPKEKGALVIDDDQIAVYAGVTLPENWRMISSPRTFFGPKNNEIFRMFPNEPWYGTINDDMLPETPGWDSILPEAAGKWGIAWADDVLYGRAACVAFGGELVRALGWICVPAVRHFYTDDGYELVAKDLGIGVYRSDVKVPHLHFSNGKAVKDKTYEERPAVSKDRAAFMQWKTTEWPEIRQRVAGMIPC